MNENKVTPFPEKTKFYTFGQNNSGGSFDLNEAAGITHYVIIQAKNPDQASALAQDIGIYFDGVREGKDCGCCGDRWHEPDEWDANDEPLVYGQPADDYWDTGGWMPLGREICVHYLDGRIEWHGVKPAKWDSDRNIQVRPDGTPVHGEE